MSYRPGIGPSLATFLEVEPGGPRITCDGCGLVMNIRENGPPPAWLLDGKPAKGWSLVKSADGSRDDRCPRCKVKP